MANAAVLDNAWIAIGVPVLAVALDRLVVTQGERFRAVVFGPGYTS